MQTVHRRWSAGQVMRIGRSLVSMALLAGCHHQPPPVYQGKDGFRITAPAGWVERARGDSPRGAVGRRPSELPLPPLGAAGDEKLLVRYDRLTAGHLAWLRVSVADLSASTSLQDYLSDRSAGPGWKRGSDAENLEVNGSPAVRIAFVGTWAEQEYLNETVAVRRGEQVYFITSSFPASDNTAREKVRQAIAGATWQEGR